MKRYYGLGFGYVELNPNLNDSYDPETGEEIYIPSNYPFDIPKVYLDGYSDYDCNGRFENSVITVSDTKLTKYTYNISNWDGLAEYNIEEFNLDTLEKKKYKVSLEATSQMDAFDCLSLIDYIDPNIINRITPNKDTNPI